MSTPEDQIPDDTEDLETTDDFDLIEEEGLDDNIGPDDIDDSPQGFKPITESLTLQHLRRERKMDLRGS